MDVMVAALLAACLGPLVARWALNRALAQPVPAPVDDEAVVLAAVLADPANYAKVSILEPQLFAWSPHRELWAAIEALAAPSDDADIVAQARDAGIEPRALPLDAHELLDAVCASLDAPAAEVARELADRTDGAVDEAELLRAGSEVLTAGDERVTLMGHLPMVDAPDGSRDTPLVRPRPPLGRARVVGTSLALGVSMAAICWLVDPFAARAALWVLAVGCVAMSLVDIDTMYIDFPTLVPTTLVAWGFAVPAAVSAGGWDRIVHAAVGTLATVVGLEVLVRVYSRLRGRLGMGGGDSALLVATLSVPLLVSGDTLLLPASILAAAVCALVVRAGLAVTRRASLSAPFAFGPYLAAGWLVGWVVLAAS